MKLNNYLDSINFENKNKISQDIGDIPAYVKGWLFLLIPVLGIPFTCYFDYIALKNNEFSRKSLAYFTVIFAFLECYYFNLYDLLFILIFSLIAIFTVSEIYLYHNKFPYKNIRNNFKVINTFLDYVGQKQLNIVRGNATIHHNLSYIDGLSGDEFENDMVFLLNHIGFHDVKHTPYSNDFGLDAIGYNSKNQKVGWQFKHYNQGDVGYHAIEETMGGSAYYGTTINYLFTNTNNITNNALKGIKQINKNAGEPVINLVNRSALKKLVKNIA